MHIYVNIYRKYICHHFKFGQSVCLHVSDWKVPIYQCKISWIWGKRKICVWSSSLSSLYAISEYSSNLLSDPPTLSQTDIKSLHISANIICLNRFTLTRSWIWEASIALHKKTLSHTLPVRRIHILLSKSSFPGIAI